MKKTLVALAALAATASFAQVSVYGRLDAGYSNTKNTTVASGVSTDTLSNGVTSHNSVSSMWGIKGTEDLGGGMNAFFQLEQDVYTANGNTGNSGAGAGASNSSGFNRTSKIGVNGGFGSIAFGRDYNANFKLIAATDVHALSRVSTVTMSTFTGGSTQANLVMYNSPVMNGFQVNADYGNQDGAVSAASTTANLTKVMNVNATYTNGPLFVGFGTGSTITNSGVAQADAKTEGQALVASYDFGKFKLVGNTISKRDTVATATAQTTDSKETNIGAVIPMGKITVTAQYARKTVSGLNSTNQVTDTAGNSWVLGADYSLSAKTAAYVKTGVYGVQAGTLANDATSDIKNTSTTVGVKTVF